MNNIERNINELLRNSDLDNTKDIWVDADAFNEIDDQFAIVHALLADTVSSEVNLIGMSAAPFHNEARKTNNHGHGMELSYEEIQRILNILSCGWDGEIYKGSTSILEGSTKKYVDSEGAQALGALVMDNYSNERPLYVLALGAHTNIASALEIYPEIINRIIICSLGGLTGQSHGFNDFNYQQDMSAAESVFSSGAAIIHFPSLDSKLRMLSTTRWELKANLLNKSPIGNFLYERYIEYIDEFPGRSKTIWDLALAAWTINNSWFTSNTTFTPTLNENNIWLEKSGPYSMKSINWLNRDKIFNHFFNLVNA